MISLSVSRHKILGYVTLGLVLSSEFLYFRSGLGLISLFLVFSVPLAILWALGFPKFPAHRLIGISYAFIFVLACYAVAGTLIYQRPTLLAQLLFVLLSPFIFLHLGYFGSGRVVLKFLCLFVFVSAFVAGSQFLFLGLGISGPLNLFQSIGEFFLAIQADFLAENIFGRSSGLFANPNSLGLFSGLAFWLIFYLGSELGRNKRILIYSLLGMCVLLSASRGSLAGILISLLAYGAAKFSVGSIRLRFRPRKLAWFALACLAVAFAVSRLPEGQLQRLSELFSVVSDGGVGGSENLEGRVRAWQAIIYRLSDFPFGTLIPPQLLIDESPDNQFIYYLAQGGYFLLIVSCVFYVSMMIAALSTKTEGGRILFAAMIFFLVNSLTMIVLNNYVSSLLWLMIGLVARDSVYGVRLRERS